MNDEWKSVPDSGLEFTVDGAFKDLLKVEVDGKILDKLNYDAKSGSTIITLKPEYLKPPDAEKHKLTMYSRTARLRQASR